jgi:hypothetical protein
VLFAFLAGLLAAFSDLPWWVALGLVAQLVLVKGGLEILLRDHWFPWAGESPYVLYVESLEASEGTRARPWIGYLVQMVGYGIPIGGVGFFLGALLK